MMQRFGVGSFVTLVVLAVINLASCQKEIRDPSAPPATGSEQAVAQIDTAYHIIKSSGGGFSGFTRGYTLFGNGRIEYWLRARVRVEGSNGNLFTKVRKMIYLK